MRPNALSFRHVPVGASCPIWNDRAPLPLEDFQVAHLRVGPGLQHFNDDFERDYYIAHCRRELEAALERRDSDSLGYFQHAGDADRWLLEIQRVQGGRP